MQKDEQWKEGADSDGELKNVSGGTEPEKHFDEPLIRITPVPPLTPDALSVSFGMDVKSQFFEKWK